MKYQWFVYEAVRANHDRYGKTVLKLAAGSAFRASGPPLKISYGARGGATVDGVVGKTVAVEIESRVSKQVRGAVLDLVCHPYPKKLLVLLPVHMSNATLCSEQCQHILSRFVGGADYQVVLLAGTGSVPALEADVARVRAALKELGFAAPSD